MNNFPGFEKLGKFLFFFGQKKLGKFKYIGIWELLVYAYWTWVLIMISLHLEKQSKFR